MHKQQVWTVTALHPPPHRVQAAQHMQGLRRQLKEHMVSARRHFWKRVLCCKALPDS